MRYSAMQNVTINLPRVAYDAHQNDARLFELLTKRIEMVAQAHILKREFITQLFNMGKNGPLSLLTMNMDGETYYRINKSSFLVGMVGLNEWSNITPVSSSMSQGTMMFGLGHSYMKTEAERIGSEYG